MELSCLNPTPALSCRPHYGHGLVPMGTMVRPALHQHQHQPISSLPPCPALLAMQQGQDQCMHCSSGWENTPHPPTHTHSPTAGCPNQLKAFKLLYLVKLCRFSSHVHTL